MVTKYRGTWEIDGETVTEMGGKRETKKQAGKQTDRGINIIRVAERNKERGRGWIEWREEERERIEKKHRYLQKKFKEE